MAAHAAGEGAGMGPNLSAAGQVAGAWRVGVRDYDNLIA